MVICITVHGTHSVLVFPHIMRHAYTIKAITAILLIGCVSQTVIAETLRAKDASTFQAKTMHLSRKEKRGFKVNYVTKESSRIKSKLIAKDKARIVKNKPAQNKAVTTFPKWMLLPGAYAAQGNDQLKKTYGIDAGLRNNLPIIQHSLKF